MLTIDYMRRSVSRRLCETAEPFRVSPEGRSARTCCGQLRKRSPTGQSAALRLVTRMRHVQLDFALLTVDFALLTDSY